MLVNVEIGGGRVLEPAVALMIYQAAQGRGAGSTYAIQAPAEAKSEGGVQLGAWEPVTLEFVRSLATGLGVDIPREVLPASVLCRTNDIMAWWTPPGIRTLFFSGKGTEKLDGEDFPVPGLVWRLSLAEGRVHIRAFRGSERPEAGTALCVAPFLNVYNSPGQSGLVCQGSMRRPKTVGVENLSEWESGFFGAAGSSQLAKDATSHKGGVVGLWRSLKGKKRFAERYLVDAGESVVTFIRREP